MVIVGIDAHKRTHTAVVIDELGRLLATRTVSTTSADHLALLRWAKRFGDRRGRSRTAGTCRGGSSGTC
jgi:hypothetical protein